MVFYLVHGTYMHQDHCLVIAWILDIFSNKVDIILKRKIGEIEPALPIIFLICSVLDLSDNNFAIIILILDTFQLAKLCCTVIYAHIVQKM
jgi:ABC-type microcin C transport system permease subunit YejE